MTKVNRSKSIRNVDLNQGRVKSPLASPAVMSPDAYWHEGFFRRINEEASFMDDEVEKILKMDVQDNSASLNRLYKQITGIIDATPVIKTEYIGKLMKKFMNEVSYTHQGMMIKADQAGEQAAAERITKDFKNDIDELEEEVKALKKEKASIENRLDKLDSKHIDYREKKEFELEQHKTEIKRLTDLLDDVPSKKREIKWPT